MPNIVKPQTNLFKEPQNICCCLSLWRKFRSFTEEAVFCPESRLCGVEGEAVAQLFTTVKFNNHIVFYIQFDDETRTFIHSLVAAGKRHQIMSLALSLTYLTVLRSSAVLLA